jgi:anhydro-N-acetylmuramic acid kinase
MSGTSVDGIDAALVCLAREGQGLRVQLEKAVYEPYRDAERERILAACDPGLSVYDMGVLNRDLGLWFARAVHRLLEEAGVAPDAVQVIGCHGQTIAHYPPARSGADPGFCVQIGDPATIAAQTGIDVVAQFRAADMALGGQGAPLIPYFDYALLHSEVENRVVLNIGGIANVTVLSREMSARQIIGFDTGPGNMVLDGLTDLATNGRLHYDHNGALAQAGQVHPDLLERWLQHPYFERRPPKSAGREQFGQAYCDQLFKEASVYGLSSQDLLRTATELVGISIARAIRQHADSPWALIASGGGTHNPVLMDVIEEHSDLIRPWESTTRYGIPSDFKEAMAFAVFAWEFCQGVPTSLPRVTGARGLAMQGSWTPARHGTQLYHGYL